MDIEEEELEDMDHKDSIVITRTSIPFNKPKEGIFLDLLRNSRTVRKNRDREVLLQDRMLFPEQFTVFELNLVCFTS